MGPDYGGGLPNDRVHGHPQPPQPPQSNEGGYQLDHERPSLTSSPSLQNGAFMPPNRHPGSPAPSMHSDPRKSGERNRSRGRGRTGSGQLRICHKCGEQLTGQFVRALDGTFHLDCFKCRVSSPTPTYFPRSSTLLGLQQLIPLLEHRIVARSLPPSSSQPMTRKGVVNIPCVRLTIFADWVFFATNAAVLFVDRTLRRLIASTM